MALKLQLVRNGKIILDIPLYPKDWSKDQLEQELEALETSFDRLTKTFDALSHTTRLRMLKQLMEESDLTMNFADFVRELDLNPKLVWENTRKLREGGLLEKIEKGRYRCSEFGRIELMMSLALRRLMKEFEEMEKS